MEAKTQKKLSYQDLANRLSELYTQYKKATDYIAHLEKTLEENQFNQTSFFVSMLFKVMEHTEHYKPEFITWAAENIQEILISFADTASAQKENVEENKQKTEKDEA